MPTTLVGRLEIKTDVRVTTTNSDGRNIDPYRTGGGGVPKIEINLIDGAAAGVAGTGKAQKHYHKKHTIANGASVTIDLNAALDERSITHNFAKIIAVLLRIRTPVTGVKAVVGNAAADPWAPWLSSATTTEDVHSVLDRVNEIDGWTVPAAANLKIAASGGNIDIDVSLIGY